MDEPLPWMTDASCATNDPEWWFPDDRGDAGAAVRVCNTCPVRRDCLEYAIEANPQFGVWGGVTQRGLTRLRVGRNAA